MVNGNYALYGDRPSSESEIVEDHVRQQSPERKYKRKTRPPNDHQRNTAILDNETDSVKCEKVKEPRLLRYVPNSDVEENFVNNKYEAYDIKPSEEPTRQYSFTKKPKNPADGSVNYAYSRSSSSCSSPTGNLPPISELGEQSYGTYRARAPPSPSEIINGYDTKFDKYFSDPNMPKGYKTKGSHPDSLYRVATGNGDDAASKFVHALRLLRWPAALVTVCIALTVFVYFLVPSNLDHTDTQNTTLWRGVTPEAQSNNLFEEIISKKSKNTTPKHVDTPGPTKTSEIDFYAGDSDKKINFTDVLEKIASKPKKNFPVPPVFPSYINPEVQYGNEKADSDQLRSAKMLEKTQHLHDDSTLKPHITQNPERPLEIHIKDNDEIITSSSSAVTEPTEAIAPKGTADSNLDIIASNKTSTNEDKDLYPLTKTYEELLKDVVPKDKGDKYLQSNKESETVSEDLSEVYERRVPVNPKEVDVKFTSGHSKYFGVSIEDVGMVKTTTQSSAYKTRVSPTLPTWRDRDGTTRNYAVNTNSDAPQCDSTRLPLCRGILPYDLAGPAAVFDEVPITALLPQLEYLIASNCSSRLIHFACALLEPECNQPPYPSFMPCYKLCKAITDGCDNYIPRELNSVFNCNQYSSANCIPARTPCYPRELACGDGTCVPRDWMCDGSNDCPGGVDESTCISCEPQEFRCRSGTCILKQWLCDGYLDCADGSDESAETCASRGAHAGFSRAVPREVDEETAGSAPALSVHKPNKIPGEFRQIEAHLQGEIDNSKELLITSDSNNGLKRNFTRRPSLSRLTPYSRENYHGKHMPRASDVKDPTEGKEVLKDDVKPDNLDKQSKVTKSKEMEDLGFFDDLAKDAANMPSSNNKMVSPADPKDQKDIGRAPEPGNLQATRLDKSKNQFNRVIDGSALLKITEPPMPSEEYEEYAALPQSGHVSPCPSGELRCVDGRCITLAQLCDGTIDCTDHADEDNCFT